MNIQIDTLPVAAVLENVDEDADSIFPWDFSADEVCAWCVVEIEERHYELFAMELPGGEVAWLTRRCGNSVKAGIMASMNSALAAAEVAVAAAVRPQLRVVDEDENDE